jgi:mannose-6-phosphate isomerase-like protein (cupin superfamily)
MAFNDYTLLAQSLYTMFIERLVTMPSPNSIAPRVLGPSHGRSVRIAGLGARFMAQSDGVSLVEHPLAPRALGSPLHRHANEDEYSYVLEGRVGVMLGEEVVVAEPGDLVVKPRGEWHAFWNAGDEPARLLEVIAPGGFEGYFAEVAELGQDGPPDPARIGEVAARYGLEIDPSSIPALCERFGVR